MEDERKKEVMRQYYEDVAWLRRCISPDDIFEFTEQALIAASFFLSKWSDWVDITEEGKKDKEAEAWIRNIISIRLIKESGYEGPISFEMKDYEEE